jgi:hypothetical protein
MHSEPRQGTGSRSSNSTGEKSSSEYSTEDGILAMGSLLTTRITQPDLPKLSAVLTIYQERRSTSILSWHCELDRRVPKGCRPHAGWSSE